MENAQKMKRFPDEKTIYNNEDYSISELRNILIKISKYIQDKNVNEALIYYEDWWQHDGLIFEKGTDQISKLFKMLESNKSLFDSMTNEYEVRIGVSNVKKTWYFRFIVEWDEDGNEIFGNFHYSDTLTNIEELKSLIGMNNIAVVDSKKISEQLIFE